MSAVKPNWPLRKKLSKKSIKALYYILKKLDPEKSKVIDAKNPRRLIRAIEIIKTTKNPVPALKSNPLPYPVLFLGINPDKNKLNSLIKKRFFHWIRGNLIKEVKKLKQAGLSAGRLKEFGLHYYWVSKYIEKKISKEKMIEKSLSSLFDYADRQRTWFKRDKKIIWVKNQKEAEKKIAEFL